ncbi:MAG TPA: CYTH domain-containing protein [Longimicrobiales bacterium]|nr:CYTH domain-containing protein [Longimicrobiales bacterium]
MKALPLEIERKYLLSGMPRLPRPHRRLRVEQGYVPGKALRERVRRVREGAETRYYRTMKFGRGVSRTEIEEETTAAVFRALWRVTLGKRVRKRRYVVPDGARCWEIDRFADRNLVLAEIELERADEEVRFPDWLGHYIVREVTDEPAYGNYRLAR